MKQFQITIFVHEDELIRAYAEGHDIAPADCPDIEQMIASELNWLSDSGISFSDRIEPIDHNNFPSITSKRSSFDRAASEGQLIYPNSSSSLFGA